MKGFTLAICAVAAVVFAMNVYSDGTENNDVSYKISGNGALYEGQIAKGFSGRAMGEISKQWIQQASCVLRLDGSLNENTHFLIEAAGDLTFSYRIQKWDQEYGTDQKLSKSYVWLKQAVGTYTVGEHDNNLFPLQLSVGLFEYKYNPDVRNLGEYLFRASAYPVYFLNWFDGPFYRMPGFKLTTRPFDWLKFDGLLFSEIYQVPTQDFSLAGVLTVSNPEFTLGEKSVKNFIEAGLGIDFSHLFSVDKKYLSFTGGSGGDKNTYYRDSIGVDSIGQPIMDIRYYSFQSTKVTGRFSIDPKALFDLPILGKEDLKIYGESAILGLKNYDTLNLPTDHIAPYLSRAFRSPIMLGFNIPAFKVLDVFSFEWEYLKNQFVPSFYEVWDKGIPFPNTQLSNPDNVKISPVKWSLYAKKKLGAFTFIGQLARDHYIAINNNVNFTESSDIMPEGNNWWWMTKIAYGF